MEGLYVSKDLVYLGLFTMVMALVAIVLIELSTRRWFKQVTKTIEDKHKELLESLRK